MHTVNSPRDVKLTHEKLGSVVVKGAEFVTVAWDTPEEFTRDIGSEKAHANFLNRQNQDIQKRDARTTFAQLKVPEFANEEEKQTFIQNAVSRILQAAASAIPTEGRESTKEKAQSFDVITAAVAAGKSPEEIMALIASLK